MSISRKLRLTANILILIFCLKPTHLPSIYYHFVSVVLIFLITSSCFLIELEKMAPNIDPFWLFSRFSNKTQPTLCYKPLLTYAKLTDFTFSISTEKKQQLWKNYIFHDNNNNEIVSSRRDTSGTTKRVENEVSENTHRIHVTN